MIGAPCPNPGCGDTERRASIWGGTLCVRCYPAMGRSTPGAGRSAGYAEPEHCQRAVAAAQAHQPAPAATPVARTARKKRTVVEPEAEDMVRLW